MQPPFNDLRGLNRLHADSFLPMLMLACAVALETDTRTLKAAMVAAPCFASGDKVFA